MSTPRIFVCFAMLGAATGGCMAPSTEESGLDPALEEDVGEVAQPMKGHNSLSVDALGKAALTANPRALDFLRSHSLRDAADGSTVWPSYPEMRYQLHDLRAQKAMAYVVSCALTADQVVSYHDPFSGTVSDYRGEHGLCSGWADSAPTAPCLEQVSACVLARVNAVGARVPLSLRGPGGALGLASKILPETRLKSDAPVASTEACGSRTFGLGRSCGYSPIAVGKCALGTTVWVGAGAGPGCGALGYSTGDTMLRICKGIYGCDFGPSAPAGSETGYLNGNDDWCGLKPAVSFPCPEGGYYSVLAAPYDSAVSSSIVTSPNAFGVAASVGSLAASEAEVFTYDEGAFYGDIFRSDGLAAGLDFHVDGAGQSVGPYNQVVPTIFTHAHACYSPIWEDGFAEQTARMCAGPSADCLTNFAGACAERSRTRPADPAFRCLTSDASGTGDYGACADRSGSERWYWPVTTYLHRPCDTVTVPGAPPPPSCRL